MKIMALDLGKDNMVGCVYDTKNLEHRYDKAPLERKVLMNVLEQERPDRVVIEIGPSAGWVGDTVRAFGAELEVANPTHEAWRWRNVKNKTDRTDALKLAQLSVMEQLPQVHLPEHDIRQWRSLIHHRHRQVGRRTRVKNRIRAILHTQGLSMPGGKKGWTKASLAEVRELARPWEEVDMADLWRGELYEELAHYDVVTQSVIRIEKKLDELAKRDPRVALLQTIPGVGPRMSEALVAVIDNPHRFKNGKQVAAYFGLVPRHFASGSMDRQGRITGAGDRMVRSLLIEVAWIMLRYNPWAQALYKRLCRGRNTCRKKAIVGVARRLVVRCWAMLRDNTAWIPPKPDDAPHKKGLAARRRGSHAGAPPASLGALPQTPGFSKAWAPVSEGEKERGSAAAKDKRSRRSRRTVGQAIPRRVASPQSPTPFRPAKRA